MDSVLTASRWDEEYRRQRYANEPPLPFVDEILGVLKADPTIWSGSGLYVGCGNGRNYSPLLDAGLDLVGLDVSREALRLVVERNAWGGFTVRYEEGPKSGLLVHFYSQLELLERLQHAFIPLLQPREDV